MDVNPLRIEPARPKWTGDHFPAKAGRDGTKSVALAGSRWLQRPIHLLSRGSKRSRSTPTSPLERISKREGDSSSGGSFRTLGGIAGTRKILRSAFSDETLGQGGKGSGFRGKGSNSREALPDKPKDSPSRSTGLADLEDIADAKILDWILCETRRDDEQRRACKNMGGKQSDRMKRSLDYIRWSAETLGKKTDERDYPSGLEQCTAILAARL
ncbi:hypothetical protein KM043_004785 [Ampulex compressa]|nr:hypothetical protein KM043_004785 [Ampulex compressa]